MFWATANLCQMEWLPPFAVLGIHQGLPKEECTRHAEDYRKTLIALRDNRLDLAKARNFELLNLELKSIITRCSYGTVSTEAPHISCGCGHRCSAGAQM
jgi:glutathione-regulated potassium-efflux system ancillary protein KefG